VRRKKLPFLDGSMLLHPDALKLWVIKRTNEVNYRSNFFNLGIEAMGRKTSSKVTPTPMFKFQWFFGF